jgi:ribosomal protein S18 acetylase RimI-like enzyme
MAEPLHVRRAHPFDAGATAALLQAIVARGGTTAIDGPVTGDEVRGWMTTPGSIWHVAETGGEIVGVQWVEPHPALPPDAASIATFAAEGRQGLGIGTRLFQATVAAARARGLARLRAVIAPHNAGGRAYYRSRGFERVADAPEGRVVKVFRL